MGRERRRRRRIAITVLIIIFLAACAAGFVCTTSITDITVSGTERYTDEEFISMLFTEEKDFNTFRAFIKNRFGETKDIPFIEKYTFKLTGLHSANVIVYDKGIAGCIKYMGNYMYFDREGVIVESSSDLYSDVPLVTGLNFQNIIMGEKLTVDDPAVFEEILGISQMLWQYDISADSISFGSDGTVTLIIGSLRVYLGGEEYLTGKLSELSDMLKELDGASGILYLDGYLPNAVNPSYPFVSD